MKGRKNTNMYKAIIIIVFKTNLNLRTFVDTSCGIGIF